MQMTAAKFWIAFGSACGVGATVLADGKLSAQDLGSIIIAFVGALFVYIAPNQPK